MGIFVLKKSVLQDDTNDGVHNLCFSPIVLPPFCADDFQLFVGDVCDDIEDCLDSSDEASCSYGMLD